MEETKEIVHQIELATDRITELVKALSYEVGMKDADAEIWKGRYESSQAENAQLKAKIAELEAVQDKIVWQQSGRATICRICLREYPRHDIDCLAREGN